MEYTTPTEQQSRQAIYALGEAERLLAAPNPSYETLALHRAVLTSETNGIQLLRMQPRMRARLESVLEGIEATVPKNVPVADAELIPGNWAQCAAGCKAKSLEIATLREIAELRVKHGKDSMYCTNGCWPAEGQIYLPGGRLIITPGELNPLMANAEEATKAHASNPFQEYFIDDSVLTKSLLSASLVLERGKIPSEILTKDFGKEPITTFIGWGREYAGFLESNGITKIKFRTCSGDYARNQKKAFSRPLWAYYLNDNSAINGNNLLNYLGRVFGVRRGEQSKAKPDSPRSIGYITEAIKGFLLGYG